MTDPHQLSAYKRVLLVELVQSNYDNKNIEKGRDYTLIKSHKLGSLPDFMQISKLNIEKPKQPFWMSNSKT